MNYDEFCAKIILEIATDWATRNDALAELASQHTLEGEYEEVLQMLAERAFSILTMDNSNSDYANRVYKTYYQVKFVHSMLLSARAETKNELRFSMFLAWNNFNPGASLTDCITARRALLTFEPKPEPKPITCNCAWCKDKEL